MNFKSFFFTTLAVGIGVSLANGNLMNTINTISEQVQVAVDPMMNGAYRLLDTNGSAIGYVNCKKGSIKLDGWGRWATAEEASKVGIDNLVTRGSVDETTFLVGIYQVLGFVEIYGYAYAACVMNGQPFGDQ